MAMCESKSACVHERYCPHLKTTCVYKVMSACASV